MMLIRCVLFSFQLFTTDGRIVYSPIYNTMDACQADADSWARQMGVASNKCATYNVCYPQ